jgi:hypothetical protein
MPGNVYRFQGRAQVGHAGAWIFDRVGESLRPRPLTHERGRELRARILDRFGARLRCAFIVRAGQGEWRALAPGVSLKLLRGDSGRGDMTAFIRMLPGSSLAGHVHALNEECLVVEGEILIGAHRVSAGDLHVALAGTSHEVIRSPRGALMLVRAEYGLP